MALLFKQVKIFLKNHVFLSYSLVFILLITLGQLPFELRDGTFNLEGFFSEPYLFIDALKQHILFLYDYVGRIKDFLFNGQDFPIYAFQLGFGQDFIYSYGYYSIFDPITIIAYIIPISHIGLSYFLMMALRVYLSGLFIMILAKMLGIEKNKSLIIVGLVYAFSFPILFSVYRHAFFINGPMYLPLLMIGSERIIQKKSPVVFILAVFFSAISQFYFFAYVVIGFGLYWLFRIYGEKVSKDYKLFFKVIFYAFIGVLMASFVLLPSFILLLDGSRASSKGLVLYNFREIYDILKSHLLPIIGIKYSAGVGNLFLLFAGFLYIFNKKTPHSFIKWSIIVFLVLSVSAVFSYFINGLTYVNNRWWFIIMVPLVLAFGFVIDGKVSIDDLSFNKSIKTLFIIILMTLFFGLTTIHLETNILYYLMIVGGLVLLIFMIKLLLGFSFFKHFKPFITTKNIQYLTLFMMIVTIFSYGFHYSRVNAPKNGFEIYYPNVEVYEDLFTDESFFRVEQKQFDAGLDRYSNDSIRYGYHSTHFYNTLSNGYIGDYFEQLKITNLNGSTGYNGLERRSILMSLNQVKYVIIRESEKTLPPSGFTLTQTIDLPKYSQESLGAFGKDFLRENGEVVYEKAYIYENQYFIDFGYMVYDSYKLEDFNQLDYLSKQKIMLDYVVLEDGSQVDNSSQQTYIEVENEIQIDDGIYRFTIPNVTNQEVYVLLEGVRKENHNHTYQIIFETNDVRVRDLSPPNGLNTYKDNTTQLVNLGYYQDEENLTVSLRFSRGVYDINRISYALLDLENLDEKLNQLNQYTLDHLTLNNDGFTGEILSPRTGYLVVTIPYSSGFKAYIDGVEVEVLKANLGFMSIEVPEGKHDIQFKYQTPGINTGIYLSSFGILLLVVAVVIEKKQQ